MEKIANFHLDQLSSTQQSVEKMEMINRPGRGGFDEGHANNVNPVAKYRNPPPRMQYMFI